MTGMRMEAQASVRIAAGVLCLSALCAPARAQEPRRDILDQQAEQRRVQEETERTVRRMSTMLRAMAYHRLDAASERRLLEEVAGSLAGLSREQMTDVVNRLEAAFKAGDDKKSQKELDAAYTRHREILVSLRGLLAKYDAVRSLEQGVERLEKAARGELDIHLGTAELARMAAEIDKGKRDPFALRPVGGFRGARSVFDAFRAHADDQLDVQRDVGELFKQLAKLRDLLPPDQKDRLARAEARVKEQRLL
jgi:hypothetical protein